MLPTPSTKHLRSQLNTTIYEPAEDSYLLLDTLSSASETAFLRSRLRPRCHLRSKSSSHKDSDLAAEGCRSISQCRSIPSSSPPLILEVGTGSGLVIAFLLANASRIFGHYHHDHAQHDNSSNISGNAAGDRPSTTVLGLASDVNPVAAANVHETVYQAIHDARLARDAISARENPHPEGTTTQKPSTGTSNDVADITPTFLGALQADLTSAMNDRSVDLLVFNPPYVPTETLPALQLQQPTDSGSISVANAQVRFDTESHLLALSYAGGYDGMEVTDRFLADVPRVLSGRGVCYVVLCARNGIEEVKGRVRGWVGGEAQEFSDTGTISVRGGPSGDVAGAKYECDCPWRWRAETVGQSGGKGGWERLEIVRIWREFDEGVT